MLKVKYHSWHHKERHTLSAKIQIVLSDEQLQNMWSDDYLGEFSFVEQYVSAQGYKVNIINDNGNTNYAFFVANGIKYTLKSRMSLEALKGFINSLH